jgi:hypothetical protein
MKYGNSQVGDEGVQNPAMTPEYKGKEQETGRTATGYQKAAEEMESDGGSKVDYTKENQK